MVSMRKCQKVTRDRLREVLSYDQRTGVFTWNESRGKARAGSEAGKLRDSGRVIGIDGENHSAARLAWFWVHGEWPSRLLRFKDGNRDNNAIDNLIQGKFDFTTRQGKNAYMKEWRDSNPRSQRHFILKRGYGMSVQDYAQRLADQNGVCAICEKPETTIQQGNILPLAVDHDHETGGIRALLCQACNRGIGHFKDDPAVLRRAADYIESHAAKPQSNVVPLAGRRIANKRGLET